MAPGKKAAPLKRMPEGIPRTAVPKALRKADKRILVSLKRLVGDVDAATVDRLWQRIAKPRAAKRPGISHSARLLTQGRRRMTEKLGEEAVECVLAAVSGDRRETVMESADLIYHLVVLWVAAGIHPQEIWNELAQRGVSNA